MRSSQDTAITSSFLHTRLLEVEFCEIWGVKFGEVRLGHLKYFRYDLFRFRFYSSLFMSYTHAQYPRYGHHSRRQKRRWRRYRVSASIFKSIWISLLHNVVKRAGNSTERCRCVFSTTDCPLNVRSITAQMVCAHLLPCYLKESPLYPRSYEVEFRNVWV
jgi:hypothetical protein